MFLIFVIIKIIALLKPIKVRFDFRPAIPAATNLIEYALLITNKFLSLSKDGLRQFDLV